MIQPFRVSQLTPRPPPKKKRCNRPSKGTCDANARAKSWWTSSKEEQTTQESTFAKKHLEIVELWIQTPTVDLPSCGGVEEVWSSCDRSATRRKGRRNDASLRASRRSANTSGRSTTRHPLRQSWPFVLKLFWVPWRIAGASAEFRRERQ